MDERRAVGQGLQRHARPVGRQNRERRARRDLRPRGAALPGRGRESGNHRVHHGRQVRVRVVPRFQDLSAGGQQERGRGRHDPVQVVGVAARVVEHGPGDAVRPDVGLGDLPVGESVRAVGLDERHGDDVDGARVAPDVGGELRDLLLAVLAGGRPEDQERRPPVRGAAGEGHLLDGAQRPIISFAG